MRIGNTSSLPISMATVSTIFESGEYIAKLPIGPTSPSPGPTLDRHESDAVKFVTISNPSMETTSVHTSSSSTYRNEKMMRLLRLWQLYGCRP